MTNENKNEFYENNRFSIDIFINFLKDNRYDNVLASEIYELRKSIYLLDLAGLHVNSAFTVLDYVADAAALIKNTDEYLSFNQAKMQGNTVERAIASALNGVNSFCYGEDAKKCGISNFSSIFESLGKKWEMGNVSPQLASETFLQLKMLVETMKTNLNNSLNPGSMENDIITKADPLLSTESVEIVKYLMDLNEKNYSAQSEEEISENVKNSHRHLLTLLRPSNDYNLQKELIEKSINTMYNKNYHIEKTKNNTSEFTEEDFKFSIDTFTNFLSADRYDNVLASEIHELNNSVILLELEGIRVNSAFTVLDYVADAAALIKNTDEYLSCNEIQMQKYTVEEAVAMSLYGVNSFCYGEDAKKCGISNFSSIFESLGKKWEMGNASPQLASETFLQLKMLVETMKTNLNNSLNSGVMENGMLEKTEPLLSPEGVEIAKQLMDLNERNYYAADESEIDENIKQTRKSLLENLNSSENYIFFSEMIKRSIEVMFNKNYGVKQNSNTK